MKNNRILKFSLIGVLLLAGLSACNDSDFLDRKPLGLATEGDLSNTGGFEEKAFGLYGQLRTEDGVTNWVRYWFQSIRSDDAMKGSNTGDQASQGTVFDSFQYQAANGFAEANWKGHYRIIYSCNDLIAAVDALPSPDSGSLINKAEACAIRAFCFFELRRDFGEIPLVTNVVDTPQDEIKAKSTVAEVDQQIIADLTFAAEHLPVSWPAYPGRATKGFAQTLLGKVYLYEGNWAQALAQFENVINSGTYGLYQDRSKLFLKEADNSPESVFEIQFLRVGSTNYSNNYWESQGIRGSAVWDLGWGFNVPTQNLIDAFGSSDPRLGQTVLFSGQDDGYGNVIPSSPPLDQPYWNKKAYTLKSEREAFGENKNHWANIRIIRYADVLLMAAEAANELGQTSVATGYLNQVRARARANNSSVLPDITSGDQTTVRNAIKLERRLELALEGERFYDLVRWGDATTALAPNGYADKNKWFPIPQFAIDQSNGVLIQNPNY